MLEARKEENNDIVHISHANPLRPRYSNTLKFEPERPCQSQDCPTSDCACLNPNGQAIIPKEPLLQRSRVARLVNMIPKEILEDEALNEAIKYFPSNYNFEIHKCVWHIRKNGARSVALQMPEGFQRFAPALRQVFLQFGRCQRAIILADVTYGACCVEDQVAHMLGCDLLIHFGHSCLIPIPMGKIPVLYVFVEITLPHAGLVQLIKSQFAGKKVALMATVQFVSTLHRIKMEITDDTCQLFIPQIKPLSPGEVLGCTSPRLPPDTDALLFVADGRFHLEAAMIANPTIPAYRYDPFTQTVFHEGYDHARMLQVRKHMIERARDAQVWGIILGTLGRQGSTAVEDDLARKLRQAGKKTFTILMKEIKPSILQKFPEIEAWVQTSCPRLSIDWGYTFDIPLLTPYELNVMLQQASTFNDYPDGSYPMDYYATGDAALASGPWTPGYHLRPPKK